MNDAAAVCVVQRLRTFIENLDDVIEAQEIVRPAIGSQRTSTLNVLSRNVVAAVLFAGIVDRQNILMLKTTSKSRARRARCSSPKRR